jgi:hypothetical protein
MAQQIPALDNKGKTKEKVCGMGQQIPIIGFKVMTTRKKGLQNWMQNKETSVFIKIHHHSLQQFKSRNQANAMSHCHLFQTQQLYGHEQKNGMKETFCHCLFICAASKELIRYPSNRRMINGLRRTGKTSW